MLSMKNTAYRALWALDWDVIGAFNFAPNTEMEAVKYTVMLEEEELFDTLSTECQEL